MVSIRLVWLLMNKNACPQQMSGFRKGRSSIDNVTNLINCVKLNKATGNITISVFLDVKGVFDKEVHESILHALRSLGVGGRMYRWILNYLRDRTVYMSTQGSISGSALVILPAFDVSQFFFFVDFKISAFNYDSHKHVFQITQKESKGEERETLKKSIAT
nr:uncharacterized protein LOC119169278 [Rhipicephalus microplus]